MPNFHIRRLGLIMEPEPGNALEVEGVLNPASVRGPDGALYLFPRLVAKGNYSRIGIARVRFDGAGDPVGIERLGVALEPEADYELRPDGAGGCEDPRVTFFEPSRQYVMTYTAHSADGPRIAMAVSDDLFHWHRLGLVHFEPAHGISFEGIDDKNASVFPVPVKNPWGVLSMAMVHRPLFPGTLPQDKAAGPQAGACDEMRESIWISYAPVDEDGGVAGCTCHCTSHHRLAAPAEPWERLKIAAGTPPVRTRHGWLMLYHGVSEADDGGAAGPPVGGGKRVRYSAGLLVLAEDDPTRILYRSKSPVFAPETPHERDGLVANVVFPTGIDRRDDLGTSDRLDVYYGMADSRIGVARLDLPDRLPEFHDA